jgi:RNA polymerase sigma-70 factor (ECF subfamily)
VFQPGGSYFAVVRFATHLMSAPPSPIENALRRAELRQLLDRLLSHLEEKDRLMLVLKEAEGFSVEEIGEILGLNVNTVKVRLFRARGRLVEIYRKRMMRRGD